jgi:hypothetical protein
MLREPRLELEWLLKDSLLDASKNYYISKMTYTQNYRD